MIETIPAKRISAVNLSLYHPLRILLVFDIMNEYGKLIHDAIIFGLQNKVVVDSYVYDLDFYRFEAIIADKLSADYDRYVILPCFSSHEDQAIGLINSFPKDKLLILNQLYPRISGYSSAVFEDFEHDIYDALYLLLPQLRKYSLIKIVFPVDSYYPTRIIIGLSRFCLDHSFDCEVVTKIGNEKIHSGTAYITLLEKDLLHLIHLIKDVNCRIGKDIGIIAYHETEGSYKLTSGLTTIGNDLDYLGSKTAELILTGETGFFRAPLKVHLADSL